MGTISARRRVSGAPRRCLRADAGGGLRSLELPLLVLVLAIPAVVVGGGALVSGVTAGSHDLAARLLRCLAAADCGGAERMASLSAAGAVGAARVARGGAPGQGAAPGLGSSFDPLPLSLSRHGGPADETSAGPGDLFPAPAAPGGASGASFGANPIPPPTAPVPLARYAASDVAASPKASAPAPLTVPASPPRGEQRLPGSSGRSRTRPSDDPRIALIARGYQVGKAGRTWSLAQIRDRLRREDAASEGPVLDAALARSMAKWLDQVSPLEDGKPRGATRMTLDEARKVAAEGVIAADGKWGNLERLRATLREYEQAPPGGASSLKKAEKEQERFRKVLRIAGFLDELLPSVPRSRGNYLRTLGVPPAQQKQARKDVLEEARAIVRATGGFSPADDTGRDKPSNTGRGPWDTLFGLRKLPKDDSIGGR